jgi:hypothetical protein
MGENAVELPRTRLAHLFAASLFCLVLLLPPDELLPALLCLALPTRASFRPLGSIVSSPFEPGPQTIPQVFGA